MQLINEQLKTPVVGEYDVIVVGGGIGGAAAALAAARNGAKTLIVEKMTVFGGLATAGHIVIYLPLCDGLGNKVIGGIGEELLLSSIKYGANDLPECWRGMPDKVNSRQRYRTLFNAGEFAFAIEELLLEAGVSILYDTNFVAPVTESGRITAVIVENKSGRCAYTCRAVVDASGDADVAYRAGAHTREQDNFLAFWSYYVQNRDNIEPSVDTRCGNPGEDETGLHFLTLGQNGKLRPGDRKYLGTTAEEVTAFLIASHKMAYDKLKAEHENGFSLASFPSMAQLRTTRRIDGAYTLSPVDLNAHFDDSVGIAPEWRGGREGGLHYEIPYRALYSPDVANMFTAGKIIAADGDTWEVTRVIPAAAMTGQASGTAAAMLARSDSSASELDVKTLRENLAHDRAILSYNPK